MSGFKNILARLAVLPAVCLVALSGFAARERGVSATPAEWRFSNGPEFPGATGKLEKTAALSGWTAISRRAAAMSRPSGASTFPKRTGSYSG